MMSWPKRMPLQRQYSLARTSTSSHIGTCGLLMGKVPRRRVAGLGGRVRSVQYDDDLNDQFVHRLAEIVVIEEQAVEDWLTGDFAGSSGDLKSQSVFPTLLFAAIQIGRASCRERV